LIASVVSSSSDGERAGGNAIDIAPYRVHQLPACWACVSVYIHEHWRNGIVELQYGRHR
jgi:hypothetical protein